jgi:hypothetical protein
MECIGFDEEGLLIRIPGPNPDDIARVCVYRHDRGYSLYFRHDLPPAFRERIRAVGPHIAFTDQKAVEAILAERGPCDHVFAGQTYQFPDALDPGIFPDVVRLTEEHRPLIEAYHSGIGTDERAVFVVARDGLIVATCTSARESAQVTEAYVHTVEAYRRRGYGRQVTAAWAVHIRDCGKIPLYSHTWDNVASQGIAQSLKLLPRYGVVSYG